MVECLFVCLFVCFMERYLNKISTSPPALMFLRLWVGGGGLERFLFTQGS